MKTSVAAKKKKKIDVAVLYLVSGSYFSTLFKLVVTGRSARYVREVFPHSSPLMTYVVLLNSPHILGAFCF